MVCEPSLLVITQHDTTYMLMSQASPKKDSRDIVYFMIGGGRIREFLPFRKVIVWKWI